MIFQNQPESRARLAIDPSTAVPIYLQIIDQIRAAIAEGTLAPGDPLPSIRRLANELQVSPNTVVQAYRELEREGIAYVQRGQGTFVSNTDWLEERAERWRLGRALVDELMAKASRLGLSASDVRSLLEQRIVEQPGGSPR